MASDEMQIRLSAKDDLTRELKNTIKNVAKLEAQLKDLGDATSPEAERDVARLTRTLDKAYDRSKTLSGAIGTLDEDLDQMGYSASAAARKTDGLRRDMDRTHKSSMTMASGWGKMMGVAAGVTGAITAMAGAFRFLGSSITEAREQRKAVAQLSAVLRSMGRSEAPKQIEKLVRSLTLMSGLEDDEILSSVNLMLTFGEVTGKTFNEAERAAVDLAAAFDMKLQSATVMVGKALNNPIGGLTSLMRVGVAFTEVQKEQIKNFMEEGRLGKAQAIIMQELKRQVSGSAAAQADAIDLTRVAWKDFQQEVGEVILSTVDQLMRMGSADPAAGLRTAGEWLRANRKQMVGSLLQVAGWTLKFASATARLGQISMIVYGNLTIQLGGIIKMLGFIAKSDTWQKFGEDMAQAGTDAIIAAEDMGAMATSLDRMGTNALDAADGLNQITSSYKALKDAGVTKKVLDASRNMPIGDTAVGMGAGALGPGGLAAAHAAYSSQIGGHTITSGLRSFGLGSTHSDHRYGRAMDIQGPRLGSYAQVVRRNGGYAAMHGTGAGRHLHVVPQTRRPQPHSSAGNTFHADVTVVNPGGDLDIQGAVARGLRDAARQTRERG